MKNHSFTEGLVVVQVANKSYNVLFESADLLNMTIKLQKLPASSTRVVDSQTLRYFIKRNFPEDTSKMFSVLHYTLGKPSKKTQEISLHRAKRWVGSCFKT